MPDVPTPAEPVLGAPAGLPLPVDEPLGLCANVFTGETRIAIAAITAVADDRFIENLPLPFNDGRTRMFPDGTISGTDHCERYSSLRRSRRYLRKLIAFDEDTFDKLTQLGRDRMATIQELADEAFADVLKKHGIPIDLRDALRKSARLSVAKTEAPVKQKKSKARKATS